jgi:zinc transport system permease protein
MIMGAANMSIEMVSLWQDDFVRRALIAGLLLAIIGAPLGCVVVWRRMAYVGDALAHSSLLGVGLGLLLGVGGVWGSVLVCVAFGAVLAIPVPHGMTRDTLLGVLAHTVLAAGVLVNAANPVLASQISAVLFGDILAVGPDQLYALGALAAIIVVAAYSARRVVIVWCLHEDVAQVEGIKVRWVALGVQLLLCLAIALAVHVVGVLMATAFLILPAATARMLARTPEAMVLIAACIGSVATVAGMAISLRWDTPSGAAMVAVAAVLCLLSLLLRRGRA